LTNKKRQLEIQAGVFSIQPQLWIKERKAVKLPYGAKNSYSRMNKHIL